MSEQDSRPVHILVFENDPAIRHMVVNYLEDQNTRAMGTPERQEMVSVTGVERPTCTKIAVVSAPPKDAPPWGAVSSADAIQQGKDAQHDSGYPDPKQS